MQCTAYVNTIFFFGLGAHILEPYHSTSRFYAMEKKVGTQCSCIMCNQRIEMFSEVVARCNISKEEKKSENVGFLFSFFIFHFGYFIFSPNY